MSDKLEDAAIFDEQIKGSFSAQMSKWQPIDTAPKDGTRIIVFDKSRHYGSDPEGENIMVVRYAPYSSDDYRHPGGAWQAPYSPCSASNPTHWMPLPEGPK